MSASSMLAPSTVEVTDAEPDTGNGGGGGDNVILKLLDCNIVDNEVGPGGYADMTATVETSGADWAVDFAFEVQIGGVLNTIHATQGPNRTIQHGFSVQVPVSEGTYSGISVEIPADSAEPATYFRSSSGVFGK